MFIDCVGSVILVEVGGQYFLIDVGCNVFQCFYEVQVFINWVMRVFLIYFYFDYIEGLFYFWIIFWFFFGRIELFKIWGLVGMCEMVVGMCVFLGYDFVYWVNEWILVFVMEVEVIEFEGDFIIYVEDGVLI